MTGDPRVLASASLPRRPRCALPLLPLLAVPAAAGLLAVGLPDLAAGLPLLLPVAAVRGSVRDPSLENETRQAVYDRVCEVPGSTIADAADAAGVSHSTATYHLERLAEASLVVSLEDGNKRRFFPNAGAYDADERRTLAALENPTTREMLAVLVREGPATRSEIAEALDVAQPTVNWHLERLAGCGLVAEDDAAGRRLLAADRDGVRCVLDRLVGKLSETGYDTDRLSEVLPVDGASAADA